MTNTVTVRTARISEPNGPMRNFASERRMASSSRPTRALKRLSRRPREGDARCEAASAGPHLVAAASRIGTALRPAEASVDEPERQRRGRAEDGTERVMVTLRLLALVIVVAFAGPPAVGASGPRDEIRTFFTSANRILADAEHREPEAMLNEILALARSRLAFRDAARLALSAEWPALTPSEQDEFVGLFSGLLERTLVLRLAGAVRAPSGVEVHYGDESIVGDAASVRAAVLGKDGHEIPLEYRLIKRGAGWGVRDVVIDGISVIASYHAQFSRILRNASYAELVARLRERTGHASARTSVAATRGTPEIVPGAVAPPMAVATAVATSDARSDVTRADRADSHDVTDVTARNTPPLALRSGAPPVQRVTASSHISGAASLGTGSSQVTGAPPLATATSPASGTPQPARMPTKIAEPANAPPASPSAGHFWVQVGAFKHVPAAFRLVEKLVTEHFSVRIEPGSSVTRVRVGPFAARGEAASMVRALTLRGFRPFITEDH